MARREKSDSKALPPAEEFDYRRLVASVADYVWEADPDFVIRRVMPGKQPISKWAATQIAGRRVEDLVRPEDREAIAHRLNELREDPQSFHSMLLPLERDGEVMPLQIDGMPVLDDGGALTGFSGLARDISQTPNHLREMEYRGRLRTALVEGIGMLVSAPAPEEALPRALELLGTAFRSERVLVFEDAGERRGTANLLFRWEAPGYAAPHAIRERVDAPQGMDDLGWHRELEAGRPVVLDREDESGIARAFTARSAACTILIMPVLMEGRLWGSVTLHDCRKSRVWTKVEKDVINVFAELVGAILLRNRHLNERRRAEEALALSHQLDNLTRLSNRALFGDTLNRAIAEGREGGFAVHYLDLDRFKDVNDAMGRLAGDLLLQQVARRLGDVARRSDVIARFGADEFAILERGVDSPEQAGELARKIIETLKAPYIIQGRQVHSGVSIGIAMHDGESDAETLLAQAELALYRAKAEGRETYRFFTPGMDADARRRILLAEELRHAIAHDQLALLYQPQVDARTRAITGVEALIRWRHPTRGIVSPVDFIPEAESNGLIIQMGDWILKTACREARSWIDQGLKPISVSVNMSAVQFRRPNELQAEVAQILIDSGLPASHLQLELTETTLMEANRTQGDLLQRFHHQGLKISLDDFGTGYSSLDYLHRYPVDQIKIAQVFVDGIVDNPGDVAICKAAISLARELNLRIVAEGVETVEQVELLRTWGCTEMQGYYFSRPVESARFRELLAAGQV
jgi:diguanylate cyclase (GGDEF)-like protein/PAS domain S-box-containing protein